MSAKRLASSGGAKHSMLQHRRLSYHNSMITTVLIIAHSSPKPRRKQFQVHTRGGRWTAIFKYGRVRYRRINDMCESKVLPTEFMGLG